jgi:plastocyanin
VKVGQSVRFAGDLVDHPIDALGGTTPNPFKGALESKSTFTFSKARGFGFFCFVHEEMNGVVWVVE